MNMQEALTQRVPRIRLERWADPHSYLRLPLFKDGKHGPWAELYFEWGPPEGDPLWIRPGSQKILTMGNQDEGFVPYTGPVSEWEKHSENYAHGYEES